MYFGDNKGMEGITVLDMAQRLKTSSVAIKMRLSRKGIAPFKYIGSAGLYTEKDFEAIKDGGTRGRPPVTKTKKPPKKSPKKT